MSRPKDLTNANIGAENPGQRSIAGAANSSFWKTISRAMRASAERNIQLGYALDSRTHKQLWMAALEVASPVRGKGMCWPYARALASSCLGQ